MDAFGPLDKAGDAAIFDQAAVLRNGNPPPHVTSFHRIDLAQRRQTAGGAVDVIGTCNEACQSWHGEGFVEAKPSRNGGRLRGRIDRNHFKVNPAAQCGYKVMRPHARMAAARLQEYAQHLLTKSRALLERRRDDNYVVELGIYGRHAEIGRLRKSGYLVWHRFAPKTERD